MLIDFRETKRPLMYILSVFVFIILITERLTIGFWTKTTRKSMKVKPIFA